MKASKLFPFSGYKSWILSYPVVLCLAAAMFLMGLYMTAGGGGFAAANGFWLPDSPSYVSAADHLLNGEPDLLRTPVYPLLIALIRATVGPIYAWKVLLLIQFLSFTASGLLLGRIAVKLTGSEKIAFWTTAAYLLFPGHIVVCVNIMTESFSISGVVLLIWFLLRHQPGQPTWSDSILAGLTLIFLIYLRPIFLYLIPVLLVYFILLFLRFGRRYRISFVAGCTMLILSMVSLSAYKRSMTRTYGIHSITMVSIVNNFSTAKEAIGMHPELAPTAELQAAIAEVEALHNQGACDDAVALMPYYFANPVGFEDYTNRLLRFAPKEVLKHVLFKRTPEVINSKVFIAYTRFPFNLVEMFNPTMHVYFVLIIWFIILWIRQIQRSRKVPAVSALLLMITLGITATSIIGAMGDWPRLNMPGIPAFLLLVGQLLTRYRPVNHSVPFI